MKINKYWVLNSNYYPQRYRTLFPATKEQFDSVCIIHYGKDFTPIVLHRDRVKSKVSWNIKEFYNDLCDLIMLGNRCSYFRRRHRMSRTDKIFSWGCRKFNKSQLLTIKKAMEEFYTVKELGK